MNHFKYNFLSMAIALLIGLTLHGCQHRLPVTGEEESAVTSGKVMPSPKRAMETTTPARKRPADALSYDAEEKKESPTGSVHSAANAASNAAHATTVIMTQNSQESAMGISNSYQEPRTTDLVEAESKDTTAALEKTKDTTKKAADEEDQKESADLKRWFQEFVEAVDDEEVLSLGDVSKAIPRLVQEGKAKGYLNRSMKLAINEVSWEPDCTPLHYAAAKGNPQAVEALVRELEVVIDAKTKDNRTTPLQFAAFEGHLNVARSLISAYEKGNKITNRNRIGELDTPDADGMSALQYAASGVKEDMNREVAELLVEKGADPYQLMDGDISLMDIATIAGNSAMVEYHLAKMHGREDEKSVIRSAIGLAKRKGHEYSRYAAKSLRSALA